MSKEEQLSFECIFDAITDDFKAAAEMRAAAKRKIEERDAAWDKLMVDETKVWFDNLSDDDAAKVYAGFSTTWSRATKKLSQILAPDLECEDCHEVKPDVIARKCPYAADIHNKVEMVTICDRCDHNRCMDI